MRTKINRSYVLIAVATATSVTMMEKQPVKAEIVSSVKEINLQPQPEEPWFFGWSNKFKRLS